MAKVVFSLCFIGILLCLSFCSIYAQILNDWCISQEHTSDEKLQAVLDDVCGRLDCKEIQPGGSCYEPNTYKNHGSYALDLDYRANSACDVGYAMRTPFNPSHGNCVFP
ncbi:X8 domain-containing protein [Artemisia annua]|uniref:X8 domain-containing protein n=1 Tax=Artemisia annua TaxID=35608 RepID=A0A2U1N0M4_ARTAN|nr:X8 domain-containing protein [Artemisia annua]